jgi:hypothetical protein
MMESDRDSDHHAVFPPPIMTDARPKPIPVLQGCEWMTTTQPDDAVMREASIEAAFFEGVAYQIGEARRAEYRRAKLLNSAGRGKESHGS